MLGFKRLRGLPGVGLVRQGGVVAAFSPSSLYSGGQLGAWYDPSDLSLMWQDSAGTTPAAVDSPVGRINDKSGNGNHLTQATASARPMLRSSGGLYWLEFDGVDDALQGAGSLTFPTSSDLVWGLLNSVTGVGVLTCKGNDPYYGCIGGGGFLNDRTDGSTGLTFVNGVQLSSEDRGVFATALGTALNRVAEVQGADVMNASGPLTNIGLSNYSGFPFTGKVFGFLLHTSNAANRAAVRTWMGAKAGLSL